MVYYASNEDLTMVGRACKNFKSGGLSSRSDQEGVSCRTCGNWSGSECLVDLYNDVLSQID